MKNNWIKKFLLVGISVACLAETAAAAVAQGPVRRRMVEAGMNPDDPAQVAAWNGGINTKEEYFRQRGDLRAATTVAQSELRKQGAVPDVAAVMAAFEENPEGQVGRAYNSELYHRVNGRPDRLAEVRKHTSPAEASRLHREVLGAASRHEDQNLNTAGIFTGRVRDLVSADEQRQTFESRFTGPHALTPETNPYHLKLAHHWMAGLEISPVLQGKMQQGLVNKKLLAAEALRGRNFGGVVVNDFFVVLKKKGTVVTRANLHVYLVEGRMGVIHVFLEPTPALLSQITPGCVLGVTDLPARARNFDVNQGGAQGHLDCYDIRNICAVVQNSDHVTNIS
jgi:hypothetical protein